MKVIDLSNRVDTSGEIALGPKESGTLTTYMIYGVLAPRETGRRLRPGKGREEILFVISGQVQLESRGVSDATCLAGSAVALPEGSDFWVTNPTMQSVQYIIAGGFTEPAHFLKQVQEQVEGRHASIGD